MTYVPHFRLSLIGSLPDAEQFCCTLSLTYAEHSAARPFLDFVASSFHESIFQNDFEDLVNDCTSFWGAGQAEISEKAVLTRIKLAPIGADGTYVAAPKEEAVGVGGYRTQMMLPHQIARKVTLETDGDLGRVKGGFYLPGVTTNGYDDTTDLMSVDTTTRVRDRVKDLINGLNNAPGLDSIGSFTVVVASQGRHNKNGSLRHGPENYPVKRVNVGRRLDVQRRRANKLREARLADADVS